MSAKKFRHHALFLATLILSVQFSDHTKAADCNCGTVLINKLWFATTSYPTSEEYPTSDVYAIGGERFVVERPYSRDPGATPPEIDGVDYETADDFSMRVEEKKPFQLVMGMPNTAASANQEAEISFSCGVQRVDVDGHMLSIIDKDSDTIPMLPIKAATKIRTVTLEKEGCGAVLKIFFEWGAGVSLDITPYKPEDGATCPGDEQSEEPSSDPGPDPESSSSSFHASYSSGVDENGVSNGMITWKAQTASGGISLDSLHLPGVADNPDDNFMLPGTEYYKNTAATRLQYKTATRLFDARKDGDTLTLKFYNTTSLGTLIDGFYEPTGGLLKTITYSKLGDQISIEKSEGANTGITHVLEWNNTQSSTTSSWTDLANARKLVTIRGTNGENRVVTNEELSADGSTSYTLISRTSREYQPTTSGGFLLYKTTEDPTWPGRGNPANVTETIYYDANGVVERRIHSDGSWSIYTTGGDDNFAMDEDILSQSVTYTPWLDSTIPGTGLPSLGNCVARVSRELSDGSSTAETYTAGILSAREIQTSGTSGGYAVETTEEFTEDGESLTSQRWTYPSSNSFTSGRLYRTIDASGRATTYSYEKMSFDSENGYSHDEDGTLTGTYATEGVVGSYDGVLDGDGNTLSTRTFTITDEEGRTVHAETQAYTGTENYETMTVTEYSRTFDVNGRLQSTTVTRDGRVISYEEIVSSTETHTTDEQGIQQIVTTDSQGHTLSNVRAGVTTAYTYSPLTTTTTQSASGLPDRTTTTVTNLLAACRT